MPYGTTSWSTLAHVMPSCLLTHWGRDKMAAIFPDDIFKCIFLNETVWISIKIPVKFIPKGPINNMPALFQIMAWRRPGDKPLSETMMVTLLTHICITRPQWVKAQTLIVKYTLRNKFQWSFNLNSDFLIEENVFQNAVCKMVTILSTVQCVKIAKFLIKPILISYVW